MDFPIRDEIRRFNELNSEIMALYHEASQRVGLSDAASFILYAVCEHSAGCTQSDICHASGLPRQTVHSAVRQLEKDGILAMEAGTGRRRLLRLTPHGEEVVREKIVPIMELENAVARDFTAEDWSALHQLFSRFRDSFRARLAEFPPQASGR